MTTDLNPEGLEMAAITLCATGREDWIWKILTDEEREDFRKDARADQIEGGSDE